MRFDEPLLVEPAQRPGRRRGRPVSDQKRRAILKAALTEFGYRGYGDTSMDVIAAKADVSKRTLYNHFKSKEALFRALAAELVATISSAATIDYSPDLPLDRQLKAYAVKSIALMSDNKRVKLFRAILAEHVRNPALVEPALAPWKGEYGFDDWVRAASADGKLVVDDIGEASHLFGSLMRGAIVWPILLGRTHADDAELRHAVDTGIAMFLSYFGKQRRRPSIVRTPARSRSRPRRVTGR